MNTNMSNLTKLDLYNTAICNITDGSLFTQSSIAAGSEMFAGANLSRLEKIYFPTVGGTYNYQDGSSGYF
ncbi:hypothetical protein FACS1894166_12940 [Bacilli bacterium]|nr:hypothetical protein FACS1894166_12940 [Bacilli bacterium]